MSKKKSYNEGMESGIKIAEEIMRKESKAMDYLKEKIDKISDLQDDVRVAVNNILDYQNTKAVEQYYGIFHNHSPKDMEDAEKHVLLDLLATIAYQEAEFSKSQKAYFANLKHYLNCSDYNPNTNYEASNIENIRNLDNQETIIKCLYEFLFLQNNDFLFIDEYEWLFEKFSIKNKILKRIMEMIDITFYLFGENGIIETYGNHFLERRDVENQDDEVSESLEEIKLSKVIIETEIKVTKDEEKIYENSAIFVRGNILCEGKLVFRNCKIIYYEENISAQIRMGNDSYIEFDTCVINGKGDRNGKFFITGGEYSSIIKNCIIEDSAYLLENGSAIMFLMDECEVINCYSLINAEYAQSNSTIRNCVIDTHKIPMYLHDMNKFEIPLYALFDFGKTVIVYNCKFIGKNDNKIEKKDSTGYELRIIDKAKEISNCSFENVNDSISATEIKDSIFINCKNIIGSSVINLVKDCFFKECKNIMYLNDDVIVQNCQFVSCYSYIIRASNSCTVDSCQFINTEITRECTYMVEDDSFALLFYGTENFKENELTHCEFHGVKARKGFLVGVNAYKSISPYILSFTDCKVDNCSTERSSGALMKGNYTYFGLFNREKKEDGIYTNGLSGFDKKAPKESKEYIEYEEKSKNVYGRDIGSDKRIVMGISGAKANLIYKEDLFF